MTDTLTASRNSRVHGTPARDADPVRSSSNRPSVAPAISSPPVVAPVAAPPAATLPSWNLTPQQWRVFLLVGRALSNKAIAHELKVAESTVKAHISAIFKVSGCRNRTEAALLSLRVRYGLLEPVVDPAASNAALNDLRRPSKIAKRA